MTGGASCQLIGEIKKVILASANMGMAAVPVMSGGFAWHMIYPWPQRPAGLIEEAFKELAKRWRPLLDLAGEKGISLCYELHPGSDVFDKIKSRIAASAGVSTDAAPTNPAFAEVIELRSRVTRWRRLAFAATAIAATMVGIFVYNGAVFPVRNQQYVAVFNQGDQQPRFVLSIDLKTRELTIRPVAAQAQSDKSYELWIVSDKIKLRSLGLLDSATSPTRKQLEGFDPALLQQATFGISLEPKGGSPVGMPTGPALHGKLIPAGN